jgi:hypothetical protein
MLPGFCSENPDLPFIEMMKTMGGADYNGLL